MTYRYHGNYCGPGWSDGKYQSSVVGLSEPVDEFDATCREHDAAYATAVTSGNLTNADNMFIRQNFGKSLQQTVAAVAVAANRVPRWFHSLGPETNVIQPKPLDLIYNNLRTIPYKQTMTKRGNLRGTQPKGSQQTKNKANGQTSYAPVARSKTVRITQPMTSMRGTNTVIKHREYLRLVTSSLTQSIVAVDVNPGMQSCFNWLSTIARGFEKYKFHKLTFTYVSASSTTEKGRVALSFQYDPSARTPQTRTDFFNVTPNVEEAPWEDIILNVQPPSNWLFTRKAGSTGTLNTYDAGKLLVMSALNANSTTQLGELFVEYEVELSRPQYVNPLDGKIEAVGATPALLFVDNPVLIHGSLLFERNGNNSLRILAPCSLLVHIQILGVDTDLFTPVYTRSAGSTGFLFVISNTSYATGVHETMTLELQQCEAGDTVAFNASGTSSITSFIMRYAEYASVAT